jgi:hypothetical protein
MKVYEYVFDATVQYRRRDLVVNGLLPNYARQPALTRTSSRIRRETLLVYYSCTIFVVVLDGALSLHIAQKWISAIGFHNLRHIRNVIVTAFDYQDLYAVAPRHWTSIQIGLDLRTLSITGFLTEHVKREEHLVWKQIMLQQLKREMRDPVITPKLLNNSSPPSHKTVVRCGKIRRG